MKLNLPKQIIFLLHIIGSLRAEQSICAAKFPTKCPRRHLGPFIFSKSIHSKKPGNLIFNRQSSPRDVLLRLRASASAERDGEAEQNGMQIPTSRKAYDSSPASRAPTRPTDQSVLQDSERRTNSDELFFPPKKFVVVTGGVISGIGKGITASSIGVLLKMMNSIPTAIKIDPYLNVDAGTMSPFEHGEVFVLDDGGETDLDLGNYERFLDVRLSSDSNLTTGKVYQAVIAKERKGEFLGKTVQIIPHITNEIVSKILSVSRRPESRIKSKSGHIEEIEPDVCVIELGGTIGDIESMPFVEALRQLQLRVGKENFCLVHVSMVPEVGADKEQKTKPTQHSVKELRSLGLVPDFIVCRCPNTVQPGSREKISMFCNVPVENVLSIHDVSNIYHVPLVMLQQKFHKLLARQLGLKKSTGEERDNNELSSSPAPTPTLPSPLNPASATLANKISTGIRSAEIINSEFRASWQRLADRMDAATDEVKIALVGKYTGSADSYLSVISALKHSCIATDQRLSLLMVESTSLEPSAKGSEEYQFAWNKLKSADAILVPGGFGIRGIEGKVQAIAYARVEKVPFLGICLGMQAAVIEYTRSYLDRPQANSREFAPEISQEDAAVVFMPEGDANKLGGTMRLGVRTTVIEKRSEAVEGSSLAFKLYGGAQEVDERHRHRYEVNPLLVRQLEKCGLLFTGKDITGTRMEICELGRTEHPFFLAVQFHPEFTSRPQRPAPVFLGFLEAAKARKSAIDPPQNLASSGAIDDVTPAAGAEVVTKN